jgi:hypothetical protein
VVEFASAASLPSHHPTRPCDGKREKLLHQIARQATLLHRKPSIGSTGTPQFSMKVLESQEAALTNYEVYQFLSKQAREYHEQKRRGPGNLETLRREVSNMTRYRKPHSLNFFSHF